MPTFAWVASFRLDFRKLPPDRQIAFLEAVALFVDDLRGGVFRPSLRVKGVRGAPGVFEMTWPPDGRATFQYGPEQVAGEPHIVWRRIDGHDVFGRP